MRETGLRKTEQSIKEPLVLIREPEGPAQGPRTS